jgi:hypothetical protein
MKQVVTQVGNTDVSTVKTTDRIGPLTYETCLFYGEKSEVVQHYDTEVEALHGHIFWVNKLLEEPV